MSDDEFDALMDNLPRSSRNKVIAQLREAEGDDAPEKHKLYSKEATQAPETAAPNREGSEPTLRAKSPQRAALRRVLWALTVLVMLIALPLVVSVTLLLAVGIMQAVTRVENHQFEKSMQEKV